MQQDKNKCNTLLAVKREQQFTEQFKHLQCKAARGEQFDFMVLLSEKCGSNTFFYSHFKQIMFGLQFRYQGTANKVFFDFL